MRKKIWGQIQQKPLQNPNFFSGLAGAQKLRLMQNNNYPQDQANQHSNQNPNDYTNYPAHGQTYDPQTTQHYDPIDYSQNPEPVNTQTETQSQTTTTTTHKEQGVYQEQNFEDEEGEKMTVGRLAYYGVLGLLVLALIGLPIWYLVNQEDPAEVAGVREDRTAQQQLDTAEENAEPAEDDEVFVYDPDSQTFKKKEDVGSGGNQVIGNTTGQRGSSSGTSVNLNPGDPVGGVTFAEAFAQARSQLGPSATFEWNGQLYSTDFRTNEPQGVEETYPSNIYADLDPTVAFVNDDVGSVLEINECNLNVKYPSQTSNGAFVTYERVGEVDGQRDYWNFFAFTGYRTETEIFGEGYTVFVQCFNLSELGESYSEDVENATDPQELFEKTGWFIADDSVDNLQMSRNEDLVHGYSITFTRAGQLYSMNFMSKPKDSADTIGGLYSYQVQMQFQDQIERNSGVELL